jgi:hypothetical protein
VAEPQVRIAFGQMDARPFSREMGIAAPES